jgi:hypothetical protein
MPEQLEPDVIYVSLRFSLVSHQCACGCGEEVVTPLSPRDWQLIFNGETVSLYPSIGNWNFQCRSHYWIDQNRAVRAPKSQFEDDEASYKEFEGEGPRQSKHVSITDQLWAKLKWRRFWP